MSNITEISPLPINIIRDIENGKSYKVSYKDESGEYRRMLIGQVYDQHPAINYGKEFLTALAITLPCIGLFFYVLFAQFGGY